MATERERLGGVVGAAVLLPHAAAAGWYADKMLGLPMEAGGLFLGPVIGLPVLFYALVVAVLALMLLVVPGMAWGQGLMALLVTGAFDLMVFTAGVHHPLFLLGGIGSAVAVCLLVRFEALRFPPWG